MTVSNTINSKEAFFFLRTLASSGCSLPALGDLTNPAEVYIDKSLKLFKKTISERSVNEGTNSPVWEVLLRILPRVQSYTLDRVFRAALHVIPGSSETDAQQIFTRLKEHQGIDLNQAYESTMRLSS